MSPEVIRHESYSFMADVYSYGVVAWQLLTHEEPFAKHTQIEAAGMVALEHARPPFPRGIPLGVANLIGICWSEDPYERVPFTEIFKELQGLNKNLSEEEKAWMEMAFGHPVYELPPPDTFEELNDEQNAVPDIDVVKAMEKRQGGRAGRSAMTRRTKSWSEDVIFDERDGNNRDGKGSKWRLSLLRKPKKY
jgi:serine/threonine protein kinase